MSQKYTKSYVYLICDPAQDLYKIGVTRKLNGRRLKQLQTGNGTELHLVSYYETLYPYRMEKMLHAKFHLKRENGEWFRLEFDDIVKFRDICAETDKTIEQLMDNPFFAKNLR